MNCRKFNEFTTEQQSKIASFLFNKKHHLIADIIERKVDDLKLTMQNKDDLQKELHYTNSKYYVIDILSECSWAVFDDDFNMYIFETQCK
jgi:NAD-dependent SIR2 family protein deacetylase